MHKVCDSRNCACGELLCQKNMDAEPGDLNSRRWVVICIAEVILETVETHRQHKEMGIASVALPYRFTGLPYNY